MLTFKKTVDIFCRTILKTSCYKALRNVEKEGGNIFMKWIVNFVTNEGKSSRGKNPKEN